MHKVLMVDDDQELCQLVQTFFMKHFLDIDAVHTGAAAVEKVKQGQYDAMILDQNLPDIHGLELCAIGVCRLISRLIVLGEKPSALAIDLSESPSDNRCSI
ncbi:hypothetical protein AB894_08275 [Piscirickettsia salmonis]|nr:hypothetical protein AB894_08275 [Piscirickettsia salmonis]